MIDYLVSSRSLQLFLFKKSDVHILSNIFSFQQTEMIVDIVSKVDSNLKSHFHFILLILCSDSKINIISFFFFFFFFFFFTSKDGEQGSQTFSSPVKTDMEFPVKVRLQLRSPTAAAFTKLKLDRHKRFYFNPSLRPCGIPKLWARSLILCFMAWESEDQQSVL